MMLAGLRPSFARSGLVLTVALAAIVILTVFAFISISNEAVRNVDGHGPVKGHWLTVLMGWLAPLGFYFVAFRRLYRRKKAAQVSPVLERFACYALAGGSFAALLYAAVAKGAWSTALIACLLPGLLVAALVENRKAAR